MAIEIVDFPIKNGDFPLLCKRLPEGTEYRFLALQALWIVPMRDEPLTQKFPWVGRCHYELMAVTCLYIYITSTQSQCGDGSKPLYPW